MIVLLHAGTKISADNQALKRKGKQRTIKAFIQTDTDTWTLVGSLLKVEHSTTINPPHTKWQPACVEKKKPKQILSTKPQGGHLELTRSQGRHENKKENIV